jgi:hypothetical protein
MFQNVCEQRQWGQLCARAWWHLHLQGVQAKWSHAAAKEQRAPARLPKSSRFAMNLLTRAPRAPPARPLAKGA